MEITGPPVFLNNCLGGPEETREAVGLYDRKVRDRARRDKRDLPAGTVCCNFCGFCFFLLSTFCSIDAVLVHLRIKIVKL